MRETSLHHSHPSLDDGGIQPISKADFERLNTCVRDLIEEERARLDSPAIMAQSARSCDFGQLKEQMANVQSR